MLGGCISTSKLVAIVSWCIFVGGAVLTIIAHLTGIFQEVWYVSILSEIAIIYAGFVSVIASRAPKDVVKEVVARTEINEQT